MITIAHIHTDFPQKFGVPRQAGIVPELQGTIVFEPEFRDANAVRGLEGFSHIWLIWAFEGVESESGLGWHPTVRPPRLGGNKRMGVFATRSPFRPNALGLSAVALESVEMTPEGPVLHVRGADLRDNTPIYDIKPYLPDFDSIAEAKAGFVDEEPWHGLHVVRSEEADECLKDLSAEKRAALLAVLAEDPRPAFAEDPQRVYTMSFAGFEVAFRVDDATQTLTVVSVEKTRAAEDGEADCSC